MAQLIVRNIEDAVAQRLKERAAANGVSMEEEHRRILRAALVSTSPAMSFKAFLLAMPDVGEDSDFTRLPQLPREVDL
ncbi:MAG: DNA-binding protein [Myxococcota bacterium]|nr:DNA-binding protein [Myxococcota bacterium]